MTRSARYLCKQIKQNWNVRTILWEAGRVNMPSICSLRNVTWKFDVAELNLEMLLAPFLCHLHSWRPQKFLFSYCPWCFTCLVFWFRAGYQSHKCYWPSKGVKKCTNVCCEPVLHSFLASYRKHLHHLKCTHHLVGGWQGQVRRCLKTIHAINLFPPKWLPINCFTLTKDGLQTLNITAGGKCRHHLRLPSIVNRVDWNVRTILWEAGRVNMPSTCSLRNVTSKFDVAELNLETPLAPFLCHLHSWRPQRFLVSYCPWCYTCLVFWFRCGFTTRNISPTNAVGLPKGWKTAQITGSSARYFCKPVLHSFLASCWRHLHVESARYLCKQTWNLHTISWHAGRVKSEGASKQFMPSTCSLRNGFLSIALPWLRMACKL